MTDVKQKIFKLYNAVAEDRRAALQQIEDLGNQVTQ